MQHQGVTKPERSNARSETCKRLHAQRDFIFMRKQLKRKLRSCPHCKPHKMGIANRWTVKDSARMAADQREMREALQS